MIRISYIDNLQHIIIYMAYATATLCPILWHYRVPLPRGTDYALTVLAVMIELTTFAHHLTGRNPHDKQVNQHSKSHLIYKASANLFPSSYFSRRQ